MREVQAAMMRLWGCHEGDNLKELVSKLKKKKKIRKSIFQLFFTSYQEYKMQHEEFATAELTGKEVVMFKPCIFL